VNDETAQAHTVRQAVAQLTAEDRAVLARVYYRSMSIVDAAAELGVPTGNVRTRTYHALHALRRALDDLGLPTS
jgi:RNA polymerase sigma-70 factor, ECF subfamily